MFFSKNILHGRWIDISTRNCGACSGFVLSNGGAARSINVASPQYTSWQRVGNRLTLWGYIRSGGDKKMDFIESMEIRELTNNKMVLTRADESFEYVRE